MADQSEQEQGRISRREVLGVAGAAVASTSGCLTALPSFGQRVRFGPVDEPSSGEPVYREWTPNYRGFTPRVDQISPGDRGETVLGATYGGEGVVSEMDYVGMAIEEFESVFKIGGETVALGNVDRPAVTETLMETGYEFEETSEGRDWYSRPHRDRTLVVGDTVVLVGRLQSGIADIVETRYEAGLRYYEKDIEYEQLTEVVGSNAWTRFGTDGPELNGTELEYGASCINFGEEFAYPELHLVYPEVANATTNDLRRYVESYPEAVDAAGVDIRANGPVLSAVAKIRFEPFQESNRVYDYPLTTWGIKQDEMAGTVTLTHEAGDTLDASLLSVQTGDEADSLVTIDGVFAEYDTVDPGTSVTVEREQLRGFVGITGNLSNREHQWTELWHVFEQ